MCDLFGDDSAANAANQQTALIEQQQQTQQKNIQGGQKAIDQAFAQFTPDYFNTAKQSYIDAYDPQLADQYGIAKDQLTSGLADRDMLESTVGANAFGQLEKTNANAQADIGNAATDFSNNLQSTVQNSKSQLEALNTGAADPATIAAQAQASGAAIQAPSSFPSLGNTFAAALTPYAAAQRTNSESLYPTTGLPFTQAPGGGSSVSFS